jgi:H+/Cl- antiporter ClcA
LQTLGFKKIQHFLKWIFLSTLVGILAGLASSVFLFSLNWATTLRNLNPLIMGALPVAGFFIGWVYFRFGQDIAAGHNLILDEIHNPRKVVPFIMAPFILLGTVITHLFGGSAGREGTAVQMGASLADQVGRFFNVEPFERKILLMAGMGAGFGSAIGAPWAGFIFGMEVIQVGRYQTAVWFQCLIASFLGYYTSVFLKAPHSIFPSVEIPAFGIKVLFLTLLVGIIFGFAAKFFSMSTHLVEKSVQGLISYPPLKPFFGGLLLIFLFYLDGSYHFVGLGIPFIQEALTHQSEFKIPLLKSVFTSLTVGTGFKGGEFIPLVYIGTTLGSALSLVIPLSFSFLGALGFSAVFAGAANTPLACAVMAMEIFGYQIGPFALLACLMSCVFSGSKGIYKSQKQFSSLSLKEFFKIK